MKICTVIFLAMPLYVINIVHSYGQSGPVIEIRRTLSSNDCDSGEVYIDGKLRSLFISDHNLIDLYGQLNDPNIVSAKNLIVNVPTYPFSEQALSLIFLNTNRNLDIILLNNSGFSNYRKRRKISEFPKDTIYVGYSLFDRTCRITSSDKEAPFNEGDDKYVSSSNIFGKFIFQTDRLEDNFGIKHSREAIVIFSDMSKKLEINIDNWKFIQSNPIYSAAGAIKGDYCLNKIEHGMNTIHYPGGVVKYERRDDVVICVNGIFQKPNVLEPVIETRKDVRFYQFRQNEICADPLGIPIGFTWYILRDENGSGVDTAVECLNGSYNLLNIRPSIFNE